MGLKGGWADAESRSDVLSHVEMCSCCVTSSKNWRMFSPAAVMHTEPSPSVTPVCLSPWPEGGMCLWRVMGVCGYEWGGGLLLLVFFLYADGSPWQLSHLAAAYSFGQKHIEVKLSYHNTPGHSSHLSTFATGQARHCSISDSAFVSLCGWALMAQKMGNLMLTI